MANYRAIASGNWSAGATWAGGAVPPDGQGHDVYANGFTVTIDQNVNVNLITIASNAGTFVGGGTAAAGGTFPLNNSVIVTANISRNNTNQGTACVSTSGTVSASIIGNISSNSTSGANLNPTILHSSSGTLNITGNLIGGTQGGIGTYALTNSSSGIVNVIGNVTGGSGGNSANTYAHAISNNSTGIINVTGNVTGGSIYTGICGITGSGQISVIGNCAAGSTTNSFAINSTGSQLTTQGDITATNGVVAVNSTAITNIFSGSFIFSADGTNPIFCSKYRVSPTPLNARTRYAASGSGTYVDMFTADNGLSQANPTDVRSGVSYASGNLTGRLTVPARGSVALSVNYGPSMPFTATRSGTTATATLAYSYPIVVGDQITVTGASNSEWNSTYTIASVVSGTSVTFTVPATHSASAGTGATMQTTGTAVLDPAAVASAVWGAATRTLTSASGPTAADNASAVWAAASRTLTADIGPTAATIASAVWAAADKTGYSLTSAERTAIATAVESSILNEGDGQAVLNAIVGAIGNTNISQVALVAAIRSDLERTGGKIDSIPAAPTAAQNASAVWGASAKVITGGVVDTLTNAPASVTPSDIWSHASRTLTTSSGPTAVQIRQEIDANSTKLDAAISSRMAASEATKLDAVKAKTDALNTERLANVATTNIVGTLLAQANS